MGCCNSTSRSPSDTPYHSPRSGPHSHPDTTTTTTNVPTSSHPSNPNTNANTIPQPPPASFALSPNTPLKRLKPWTAKKAWSRSALERERAAFFDTRVTGRSEVWHALKLVTEQLRAGDVSGAQSLLDAAECTCPMGDLVQGVYDERGALYALPNYIVGDPANVVEDGGRGGVLGDDDDDDDDDDGERESGAKEEDDGAAYALVMAPDATEKLDGSRRDDKGKSRLVDAKDAIKVRARLSDRGTDVVVLADRDQPVRVLIQRVHEEAGVSADVKIKLAYLGKIMKDNLSLAAQGWQQGHVLNALVFE